MAFPENSYSTTRPEQSNKAEAQENNPKNDFLKMIVVFKEKMKKIH